MYHFKETEKKWQTYWDKHQTFKTNIRDFSKPKYYVLDMFPYPSGQGLHVGHPEGYTASDIMARMKRMQGYNVLHPMGFDSFGLPAEQYAIKTGNHPETFTKRNIETFTNQLKMLGFSFDWSRQVSTCDPKFYKWTQWIFTELYKDGLAKNVAMPVNWCEELGCVLSNDEIIDGKSERGGFPVVRRNMKQWVLNIPKYADELLEGLNTVDWPESTKEMQRNWIGKSIGAHVKFTVQDTDLDFTVFTTRADTLFGATYCVLAPEHALVKKITTADQKEKVEAYIRTCATKSELERTELNKDKTGVFTGAYAINPVNQKAIPIWIADYVLATYGTGAIMAVPAHDDRDFEFASKFGLEIIPVIKQVTGEKREHEREKKSIVAVVYDPRKEQYLTIHWNNAGGRLFVGGTRQEQEEIVACAKREIAEETGYTSLKLLRQTFPIEHHYFAYNKNQAFMIEAIGLLFELESDTQQALQLDEDEKGQFTVEWVSKEQMEQEVKDELHRTVFENLLDPKPYVGDGIHINSDFLNGLEKETAISKMIAWLEAQNLGTKKINYRLREWIFARQRYWGEPIPIVHMEDGTDEVLKLQDLPLVLPSLEDYSPSKTGASPLEKATDWVNVTIDGKKGKRETSTMPGAAGSSWYFLRYIDPHNEEVFADKELLEHWMPVDLYVGGPEHAVGHLLYSRFWNRYLYQKGYVTTREPFQKLCHQGMILGPNGEKMSKSKGNVINPDDMVATYGADALRLYEMFMGPLEAAKPWDPQGIEGSKRFLDRVWRLIIEEHKVKEQENPKLEKIYHQTVKKVTEDYEAMRFNTAISQMMIFVNAVYKEEIFPKEYALNFIKLLNPIAPHMTEEMWNRLGEPDTITYAAWPTFEEEKTKEESFELIVQVNGKVRGKMTVLSTTTEAEMKQLAATIDNVQKFLEGKEIVKMITIPGKLVNIVVK